jgi:hypothetical protein
MTTVPTHESCLIALANKQYLDAEVGNVASNSEVALVFGVVNFFKVW